MEFVCTVGTVEGEIADEMLEARSEEAARRELERRGYHVFKIRRRRSLGKPSFSRTRKIAERHLLVFNQEFAALLKSGLPVLQAVALMHERQKDPLFKEVLGEVHRRVRNGEELSTAFGSFGSLFPALYAPTLKAGEQSGELEQVIRRFVRYQKLIGEARRKVVSALVYPAVLIGLSVLLMVIMAVYVVPKFSAFFAGLDAELPAVTRLILAVSSFLSRFWLLLAVAIAVIVVFLLNWRRSRLGALTLDRWKLRIPVLGTIFQRLSASEFCRSLSTLLAGGIPAVSALENSVAAVSNAFVRDRLEPMIPRIRQGEPLHAALEDSGVAPDITIEMAKVGEETGSLDTMLGNASDFLDEEVDTQMQRLLTLVEPIMLIIMGLLVATLLMAVYLPLFSMLGQVRGV